MRPFAPLPSRPSLPRTALALALPLALSLIVPALPGLSQAPMRRPAPLRLPRAARRVRPPVPPYAIQVNGRVIRRSTPPVLVRGTLFVPMRFPAEELGAMVKWHPRTRQVTTRRGAQLIRVGVGSLNAWVNSRIVTLYERPFILQKHVYVPLRFIAESMGAQVRWDGATHSVDITTNGVIERPNPNPNVPNP